MKNISVATAVVLMLAAAVVASLRVAGGEDTWVCEGGEWIAHGKPSQPAPKSGCAKTIPATLEDGEIPWDQAVTLIRTCQVSRAFQAHSRDVELDHKDGRRFRTVEPSIDLVLAEIGQAQAACGRVPVATE